MKNNLFRFVAAGVIFCLTTMGAAIPVAQAGMIGTGKVIELQQGTLQRSDLAALLERGDVARQLLALGVDPAEVRARVASLSDREIAALAQRIDELPAGGDVIGAAVFIFLVLLVTDLLGYTDVFPFVTKTID